MDSKSTNIVTKILPASLVLLSLPMSYTLAECNTIVPRENYNFSTELKTKLDMYEYNEEIIGYSINTNENDITIITNFAEEYLEKVKELDPDISILVDKNFWELLA